MTKQENSINRKERKYLKPNKILYFLSKKQIGILRENVKSVGTLNCIIL